VILILRIDNYPFLFGLYKKKDPHQWPMLCGSSMLYSIPISVVAELNCYQAKLIGWKTLSSQGHSLYQS